MKKIVITGASRGIGKALTQLFLEDGHKVYAISRSKTAVRNEIKENLECLQGDICNGQFLKDLEHKISEVDILIHNAGYLINKPMPEMRRDDINASFDVNFTAPYLLTQSLLSKLNNHAHVLFISSAGGVTGSQKFPGLSVYSSSKAAMACLAECLQAEFAEKSYTFNALALGAVQTEMLNEAFPGYQAQVKPADMAAFVKQFALFSGKVLKGKTTTVSVSNP